MDLSTSLEIAAAGMRAQGTRIRVVSENLANASSTAETPDGVPYRRQVITFRSEFDRELGANTVAVSQIGKDPGQFARRYEPHHPSADDRVCLLPERQQLDRNDGFARGAAQL